MPDGHFIQTEYSRVPNPPPPPPVQPIAMQNSVHKTTIKINPQKVVNGKYDQPMNRSLPTSQNPQKPSTDDAVLIARVDAKAVGGGGQGVLYSSVNNVSRNPNLSNTTGGKPNIGDPQVRKLVYNMYRGLLNTKHDRANDILDSVPSANVAEDEGVNDRVRAMMRQQTELREGKMINLGPPPPPPPPPFSTGTPSAQAPKPTSEQPARAVPSANMAAPPAVLASAMMKEKKPFTYTPGGLNLAEINDTPTHQPPQYTGNARQQAMSPPLQKTSSFGVNVNTNGRQSDAERRQYQTAQYEPKSYGGSHIPSRSFRILQAMTDTDEGVHSDDSSSLKKDDFCQSFNQQKSALKERSSPKSSESGFSFTSEDSSSKCTDQSTPSSFNKTLNSALDVKQDYPKANFTVVNNPMKYRQSLSSNNWQKTSVNSASHVKPSDDVPTKKPTMRNDVNISEIAANNMNGNDDKLIYGGNKIPSRLFKQLQNNFSTDQENHFSKVGSKPSIDELLPQLTKNLNMTEKEQTMGSRSNNISIHETVSAKQSVLKELTSQFDPQTNLKKPRAAPGRVFHYLQQKYDDIDTNDTSKNMQSDVPLSTNTCHDSTYAPVISGGFGANYEIEPKPYNGSRIPGRTFKLLQANIDTHPSVLQDRK